MSTIAAFNQFTSDFEARLASQGLPLHEYQALMALRLDEFRAAIAAKIEGGNTLLAVVRVYYSQVASVIEVAARFSKGEGLLQQRSAVLVTFKATDFSFVSLATDFEDLEADTPQGVTLLPISMSAPTSNEAIGRGTDMSLVGVIEARRQQYLDNLLITKDGSLVAGLLGRTNCGTGRPSTTYTNENSSYTTARPGGGTMPDTKIDQKTDDNMDTVTDTNDDSN